MTYLFKVTIAVGYSRLRGPQTSQSEQEDHTHTICPDIVLTHWGRVTHICVSKLTIICSDNGLSPGRRQAIIWINAGILLIRTLGTNFSEMLGKIHSFSFKKMHLKMSSAKGRLISFRPQWVKCYVNRLVEYTLRVVICTLQW